MTNTRGGTGVTSQRASDSRYLSAEYGLDAPVLAEISEIVHDADLMDEKYGRPESEGLDATIRGMQLALADNETLTRHVDRLYDGLHAYLGREVL